MTETSPTVQAEEVEAFRLEILGEHDKWRAYLDSRKQLTDTGDVAALMAVSYAYTLAAILRAASIEYGVETAHRLAHLAEQIITDGDEDNLNGDLRPAEASGVSR